MAKTEKFVYDVFVSYAGKDRVWIKKNLLPKLKQRGIKYCVDYRDFPAGKSSMVNMSDAVNKSRHTLLVMTPNWVKTEWTFFEALLARRKDPIGIRQRTIPMLVKKCKVADILSILTWVDFTERGSKATAWNQLYTAIGKRPIPKQPRQIRKKKNANWHLAHPYPMPPNFTGREAERNMLSQWLNEDKQHPLLVLRALGGFGKSALSWYWLTHDVDPAKWQKVVFWSFYEGDANFENFLKETLEYLGFTNPERVNPIEQTDILLNLLHNPGILLIMDGFERTLRAYGNMGAAYQADEVQKDKNDPRDTSRDCISPHTETFLRYLSAYGNFMHSKVLMTTRLTPRAVEHHGHMLEGCFEKELMAMDKDDAVKFFRSEGIRGTHAEIKEACAPYGFHPLSLRLLAGLIVSDLQTPGDIIVAKRLDISNDIVQNKHHVLEQAYITMSKERQKLLSQIACFRSPVTYDDLKSITTVDIASKAAKNSKSKSKGRSSESKASKYKKVIQYPDFDNDLRDLLSRGLLHHDLKTNKYDLHPIVRRFAYDRLTAADRRGAHQRLVNYFEAVPKIEKVGTLDDLGPVIELYHHMVRAGKLDEALKLFYDRIDKPSFYQFGAYQLRIELLLALFPDGENKTPKLEREDYKAFALNELANSYSMSGQPRRAVPLLDMANDIYENQMKNKGFLAVGLGNVATQQMVIGAMRQAERDHRRRIDLSREIKDEFWEAVGHRELGRVLFYRGEWNDSEQELETATKLFEKENNVQSLSVTSSYRALRFLLMSRADPQSSTVHRQSSIKSAFRALEFADEDARTDSPTPRDYIRAYWLLGAAHRANGDLTQAEENLSKAINMCRQINLVESEADILLDLARLRYDQKNYEEAKSLAEEALSITERCGYVLQGADVNLFLAQYALEQEKDKVKAKEYAATALKLATCDDGLPYYYKVAYEEAQRLLEKLE